MERGFVVEALLPAFLGLGLGLGLGLSAPGSARAGDSLAPYERAAELNPDSPQAQFNLGVMSLRAGDNARAARALGRATRLSPDDAEAWQAYGRALAGLGRRSQGLDALRRSVRLDSRRAGAWMELAQDLSDGGTSAQLGEAVEDCARAARLEPRDPRPWYDQGLILARLGGRDAEAVKALKRAGRLGSPGAAKALCVLYNRQGDYPDAERACRSAVDASGDAETWYDLGFALEQDGRAGQARSAYGRALALEPHHAAALYALAFLDFQAGDADRALQGFQAALAARHGDYPEAEYNAAVLLGDAGRYEEAAGLYRGLLRRRPHDADAQANLAAVIQAGLSGLLTRGQSAYERGDLAAARSYWRRARRLDPSSAVAGRMLDLLERRAGSARARAARLARAKARSQVAARLRAQDAAVRGRGLRALERGDWAEAERCLTYTLAHHPDDAGARRALTQARGRQQAALDARALKVGRPAPTPVPVAAPDPVQVRALYYEGVEQYLAGNLAGAVDIWRKVLGVDPGDLDAQRSLARAQLELRALRRLAQG